MLKTKVIESTVRHLQLTIDEDIARGLLALLEANTSTLNSSFLEITNGLEDFLYVELKEEPKEEKRQPKHGETIWVLDEDRLPRKAQVIHLDPLDPLGVLAYGTKKGKLGEHIWSNWTFYK